MQAIRTWLETIDGYWGQELPKNQIYLKLFIIAVGLVLFVTVIRLMIRKRMSESASIIWFLLSVAILIFAMFPIAAIKLSEMVGIMYAPAFLFTAAVFVILFIVFRHSIEISVMESKVNEVSIMLSLTLEENKELKKRLDLLELDIKGEQPEEETEAPAATELVR